ncbi:MAG: translocation/assembly module TamB domain-containing protein, partial [Bacteroidota bacterium]
DEAVGDVMKGKGQGHLSLEINNLSTFNMYGTVELVSGDYLFTLKNLLNKEFTVRPGGTISWFGDPFAADLNMEAIYKVSASLYDLMPDAVAQNGQRVPVDLIMKLSGRMLNPGINFDVALPTADELTRSRVASVISTDQERNRQAFSLLVLRRFVTPPNITADRSAFGTGVAENSTELLSSQISNWLSQISDDFNLGFNYRPGDQISNEEIALALSTQLFNERLAIAGNFGVRRGNEANQNPTNYIGDIRVEYKITRDGRIRLIVYNESNDFRTVTTQQSPYTQGVGVLYQNEFDDWEQFVCGFTQLFVPESRRTSCL